MSCCDTCRFVRDRRTITQPIDGGGVATLRSGWCHRIPPAVVDNGMASAYPPVNLTTGCGEHRYSIAGLCRAIAGVFR